MLRMAHRRLGLTGVFVIWLAVIAGIVCLCAK
jgi:hypothetical protein